MSGALWKWVILIFAIFPSAFYDIFLVFVIKFTDRFFSFGVLIYLTFFSLEMDLWLIFTQRTRFQAKIRRYTLVIAFGLNVGAVKDKINSRCLFIQIKSFSICLISCFFFSLSSK